MLTNNSPSQPSYFDLKLAYLVSPKIDLRRLERSFTKLTARHDALRQSFERQGDAWVVNIWNRHRTGVMVEDHGDIGDPEFYELLQRHSSVSIGLLDDVLFQVVVLRCGRRGDVLFIRCHHAIVDGHSLIVLTEDWLRLLIGIPLLGHGVTHEEFLMEQSNLSARQKLDNQEYWNELLFPVLPNPGIGRFGKSGKRPRIVYRTDTNRSIKSSLTNADVRETAIAVNDRSRMSFSIFLAAFADTLIELSGLPGIYVSTVVDRTSNKLRNFVGCAIDFPPIRCDASNGAPLTEYAAILASQLKQSLIHLPNEAAALELDYDLAVDQSGGLLRHFFCVLSLPDARAKRSPFSSGILATRETPQKIGPLTVIRLDIETQNHNFSGLGLRIIPSADQTALEFVYHSHFYSDDDMQTLLSVIGGKLRKRLD